MTTKPDCGSTSCPYAEHMGGMRVNGPCRCDECPVCGGHVGPGRPKGHRQWCTQPDWLPEHHRKDGKTNV